MNDNSGESRISLLLGSTALAGVVAICLGSDAAAQTFTGNQTTSGPFAGGTQFFYDTSKLNASADDAVSGGVQSFFDTSALNASTAFAVSGGAQYFWSGSALNASAANAVISGTQDFYNSSALNASAADAVSGGSQNFWNTSALNASAADAVSGGTQSFYNSSTLDASAADAVSGGSQFFLSTSALNASTANAVSGGTQRFFGSSALNASAANAVSGGSQRFDNSSTLNASAANAVSGGTQNFTDASTLNASASNAVGGGTQNFYDASTLNASAANAVSGGTQNFTDASGLNASAANAVSGGTQNFYDTSTLNASAANAVSGGTQFFFDTSSLNASAANAVSGGTQAFYDASVLNASAASAVSGGQQIFGGTSALNALAANAVSGGSQGFNDASALNASAANAVSGGVQYFYNTSTLDASAADAVSGGTQFFIDTSALNASAANALSGGTQNFYNTSALNASAANALSGGTQNFGDTSALNASATNALSGGTQNFSDTSALNASATNAVSGGEQYFWGASALDASAANAVSGGMQDFNNTSSLNASAANAVYGGTQYFWGTSALNASVANAVSGGTQYFSETSVLNASVANAVSGGQQYFYDASTLNVLADNALTKDVTVNFDNQYSGPGGTLRLNGYSTTVGAVQSLSAGSGVIENGGGADSILTIDGSTAGNSSFSGLIRDGGAGRLGLSLASGALTLDGVHSYTGPTTINGGTLAITSTGGIASNVTNNARFENAGTVAGSVTNTAGATFTQTGGSVSGGVTNAGTVNANGGALNGAIVNSGTFTVAGSTTGNGAFGNSGTFALAGGDFTGLSSFTNSGLVTAANGGTLGAASFINATGGIVDLRNGTAANVLNMAGSVTFDAGSIYRVAVNAAGQSDRIAVTGAANISGATLDVSASGLALARYTVITTTGGLTGTFGTLTGVGPISAFVGVTASYDANNAYLDVLQVRDFADAGVTRNQKATASGIQSIAGGNPVFTGNALYDAVLALPGDAAARNAFDQLSGEVHASAKTALIEGGNFVRDAATNRIRAAFGVLGASSAPVMSYADPAGDRTGTSAAFASRGSGTVAVAPTTDRFALWGQGFGGWGSTNSDGNAARLSHATGGFLIGGDAPIFDNWRLGMMAGYSRTNFNVRGRLSSGSSDNYHLGLYGGTQWGNLGFRTGAAYTWHDIETGRSVGFAGLGAGFGDSLKGDYRAGTAQLFGELGYGIRAGSVGFEPFANLAYVNLSSDDFTEQGGVAAVRSSSTSTGIGFTTLGLHASTDFDLGTTTATLRSTLGWRHAFGTPLATFTLAGGSPFTVAGVPIAGDALVLDVGLDVAMAGNTTLGVSYGGQYGGNAIDQSVRANLNVSF